MAFTNVIRRAAYRVIPSAIRASRSQHQSFSRLLSTAAPPTRGGALSQTVFRSSFSTATQHNHSTKYKADETLLQVISSEIQCALESETDTVEDVPESFPFKIIDEPGQQTVTVVRDDHGERVSVEVHMPDLLTEEDDDSETGKLSMVVKVSKKYGPCLEFDITSHKDEIYIDSVSLKDKNAGDDEIAYEGPEFGDLDEDLQKAFNKYLDVRGVNLHTINFLHSYMINKDSREYVEWLKNVKKFVEA